MRKVLITGSSGFLGIHTVKQLSAHYNVVPTVRRSTEASDNSALVMPLDTKTAWKPHLKGIYAVVHIAGLAHDAAQIATEEQLRNTNVYATQRLVEDSIEQGVKRFVFISSIGVNGRSTTHNAFTSFDFPAPHNDYAKSKYEAEQVIKSVCMPGGMEFVIIRPPLVYGPLVKANFKSLLGLVSKGMPLPLGSIRLNKRSLVYVENLADLIRVCIEHPGAANQTFTVSDDEDVSTRELLERVAAALGVKSRLLSLPTSWLGLAGRLFGKKGVEQQLCASLQVDITHTKRSLHWKPPFSMDEGLRRTAEWYKAN